METSRIFIKGLPPNLGEAEARKHFSAKGREITDIKLIPQRRIGYVGYKTPDEAAKAIKYFNKSYIRMSKISVEAARPISESLPRGRDAPAPPPQPTSRENAPKVPGKDDNTKKRKRQELNESDPKLQEFLQVMKPGGNGVLDDDLNYHMAGAHSDNVPAVIAEGESDDEYEQIPARKEKQRRIEPPQKEVGPSDLAPAKTVETPGPPVAPVDTAMPDVPDEVGTKSQEAAPAATDEDWLRSRTNRLLDLVDADDLPAAATADSNGVPPPPSAVGSSAEPAQTNEASTQPIAGSSDDDSPGVETGDLEESTPESMIRRTSRLFIRNLPYTATEDDLREQLEKFGTLEELHLPTTASGSRKGFALVLFADPSSAVEAFQTMDGATFQGRILHIIPGNAKKDVGLDEFALAKLPLKKQNMIRKKAEASSNTFNWNSLYMSQDAVNTSIATRLGVSKSELLDPTSADAAVKQAIAETTVIQDTKAYFAANGVDLDAFKSNKRGDTAVLVKNFPYGTTMEELRQLFEESGPVLRVLMPPSGTIAIVQFAQSNHAKAAFGKLAYRRIKDSVLFLEKAPKDIFKSEPSSFKPAQASDQPAGKEKLSVNDLLSRDDPAEEEVIETSSLFVRNLNFATTTSKLAEAFQPLDGFVSARVKTKMDPKKPGQTLSMGFGFVEFRTKELAQKALESMDGTVLDGHKLAVKASHKGYDAAEERRREDKAKKLAAHRTKIIIKNLPFQATKKDVRALFGTYGQLRSVRVPKKADSTTRGFAFADFVTSREAENALNALRDTHLLGRKLVLDFAEAEAVDAEEEIEKMQRKVGGQVNKVALQQLTAGGRRKVNIGNNEEEDFEG
ncbi:hypothetical protein B0I35DRAFT_477754 [Stachybotrys elegans]|uniref:Multiple RNA-binding domain-containing protein 1 n=1 Tax=Stachybotrys elegans TaxID=80388 RepID=A0A8K0SSL5_9HYPO|nr:hypothetical protein B0I35DRAFT_477754 [Stachybotrys elegans]